MSWLRKALLKVWESFWENTLAKIWTPLLAGCALVVWSVWQTLPVHWKYLFYGAAGSLALFGLVSIFIVVLQKRKHAVKVIFEPSTGPGSETVLGIRNRSESREFWAQGIIVAAKNTGGGIPRKVFDLRWENSKGPRKPIGHGETANLVIARWSISHGQALGEMRIVALSGEGEGMIDSARWNLNSKEELPEYEIEVRLFAEGTGPPQVRRFCVKPSRQDGPLEMVPAT